MKKMVHYGSIGVLLGVLLGWSGCGGGGQHQGADQHRNKQVRTLEASGYLTKGNFVDAALFCYRTLQSADTKEAAMQVALPGGVDANVSMQPYHVEAYRVAGDLKRIRMYNYANRLEVKFVDGMADIHLFGSDFTMHRQIPMERFVSMVKG